MRVRFGLAGCALSLVCWCTSGCGDIDWNWDTDWWKKPSRTVRPTRPEARPAEGRAQARSPRDAQGHALHPGRGRETTVSAPQTRDLGESPDDAVPNAAPTDERRRDLPFYQLYMLSREESDVADLRGEHLQRLEQARARPCATLLEMLYVPIGRSGSRDECYLLYENFSEFEAAREFAPTLDISQAQAGHAAVGAQSAYRAGIAAYLRIAEQGAVVERGWVDECERHLAEATQSGSLPPLHRWAAGILAGRLVADHRYDFPSARSYYRQAQRAARPESLERMTALWWYADALTQEGETRDARAVYETILAEYQAQQGRSHIVARCRAILGQRKR